MGNSVPIVMAIDECFAGKLFVSLKSALSSKRTNGDIVMMFSKLDVDITYREKTYTIKGAWLFLGQLLIIATSYFLFLNPHFSVDSYVSYYDSAMNHYLSLGRVVNYIVSQLLKLIHVDPVRHQAVFIGLLMIIMAISAVLLTKQYFSYLKTISPFRFLIVNVSILISFINIYLLEWYLFPEVSFIYGLGFLFATMAVMQITKKVNIRNLLICSIYLTLAENIYQINITVFIIFSLVFLLIQSLYSLNIRSFIKTVFSIGIVSVLTMLANVAIMRLLPFFGVTNQSNKLMELSLSSLWDRFVRIFTEGQVDIWAYGSGFMGSFIMGAFLLVSVLVLLIVLVKYRKTLHVKGIASIIFVLLLNYSVVLLPHLITADFWMAPRTLIGIFLFLTSIYLFILIFPLNRRAECLVSVLIAVFLVINIIQISRIGINVLASNRIDQEYIHLINNEIDDYEKDTGITVSKIAVAKDEQPQYGYYDSVEFIRYDTNVRALVVDWAVVSSINYYSGRNFSKVEMPVDVYATYFKGKNWSAFDPDEQLVFIGDTLYLVSY